MNAIELKQVRKALKLTQARLAEALEVTPNTVARWEMAANRGRYPVPKWVSREVNRLLTDRRMHLTDPETPQERLDKSAEEA